MPSIRQAALPRFALADEALDPSEVVATAPRAAMTPAFASRTMRARADSTQEIGVEDILLEVYADPPRSADARPRVTARAAAPSPSPSEQRAVDDLLRVATPAEAVAPQRPHAPSLTPGVWPMQARTWSTPPLPMEAPDYDEAAPPSIAPVTASVEVVSPEIARQLAAASEAPSSAGRIAMLGVGLLLMGVVIGVAIAFVFPEGPLGRLLHTPDRGQRVAAAAQPSVRAPSAPIAVASAPIAVPESARVVAAPPAPAAVAAVAPAAVTTAAPAPAKVQETSPVAAAIANATSHRAAPTGGVLVLPPKAVGHRVWFDRVVLDGNARSVLVPCGVHKVKIGSKGHARRVDIPCGGTLTL